MQAPLLERRRSLDYEATFPPLYTRAMLCWLSLACALLAVLAGLSLTVWRETAESLGFERETLLEYLSIPVVSTVFTYIHIWAALYMTFYPLTYRGCCQIPGTNAGLGWQGIVPSKIETMARTAVHLMTHKVANLRDVMSRVDPAMVAQELEPVLQGTLRQIIEEVAMQEEPELWKILPEAVKQELVEKARADSPRVVVELMTEMKENVDQVFDLSDMVVNSFMRNPGLLNHMFISCGYAELLFIRNCGAYMGILFGIIQLALWTVYAAGWMLPAFGLVAGCVSNWIALKMIFEPVEARYVCGFKIQGLFLQRQDAVSAEYARIVSIHVLSARYLIPAILSGPCSGALFQLVHEHLARAYDNYTGMSKHAIRLVVGTERYNECRQLVNERIVRELPELGRHLERPLDSAMNLEELFSSRMAALPSLDFEQLLHPVFQEDEWKLVLMGGVLGIVVGCLQWAVLGS